MKICWIGLGPMGFPMAVHLSEGGYGVVGFDLSQRSRAAAAAAGLRVAESVHEAAAAAAVVVTMLPSADQVRAALLDSFALAVSAPEALVIDCSAIAAGEARDIGGVVTATGRRYLDAPVSCGTVAAKLATLTFMVGGAPADLDDARPLLAVMGARVFHAGGIGAGQSAKMLAEMLLATSRQSSCEMAALAERLGIAPASVIEIAETASGESWTDRNRCPVPGVSPTAAAQRYALALALDAADEFGVRIPVTAAVARRLGDIDAAGAEDLVGSTTEELAVVRPAVRLGNL